METELPGHGIVIGIGIGVGIGVGIGIGIGIEVTKARQDEGIKRNPHFDLKEWAREGWWWRGEERRGEE